MNFKAFVKITYYMCDKSDEWSFFHIKMLQKKKTDLYPTSYISL